MYDKIEEISGSTIQHGPQNDRIYLMHLAKEDMPQIVDCVENMAIKYKYSKIFAKVPDRLSQQFSKRGYLTEATISGFFGGVEDGVFMSKYFTSERSCPVDETLNNRVLYLAKAKETNQEPVSIPTGFQCRLATKTDAQQMSKIYSRVFKTYPFPIADPQYIEKTMEEDVVYFGVWKGDELVALSSCEMSIEDACVEMTDFAVDEAYRGYQLASVLLNQMEVQMKRRHIKTAYTIARSNSYGMNNTFAKAGYTYAGTLMQNTQIGGQIEDMNVWYKALTEEE